MNWHDYYKQAQHYLNHNNIIIPYKDLKKIGIADLIVPHLEKECDLKRSKDYKKKYKGSTLVVVFIATFSSYYAWNSRGTIEEYQINDKLCERYIDIGLCVLLADEKEFTQGWNTLGMTVNNHALAIEKEEDLVRIYNVLASRIMAQELEK